MVFGARPSGSIPVARSIKQRASSMPFVLWKRCWRESNQIDRRSAPSRRLLQYKKGTVVPFLYWKDIWKESNRAKHPLREIFRLRPLQIA